MAKRGQGEGSISKRSDGTWWARISIGRDENGKRKRKAFYGRTRKEVQEKLTAALNDVNNNVYIEPSNMTVRQWGDLWLREYKKPALRPTTYRNYFELLKSYIYPHFGEIKLKNLRNDIIQKGINDLSKKGVPPYTVRSAHEILYRALEQAVKNELLAKNIAKGITLPAEIKKPSRALTLEEQEKFVALTKEFTGGDAFLMSLATGMRIGEVLALTWDDIDWDDRVVTVNKTLSYVKDPDDPEDKWHNLIGPPKTKCSNRKIPLFPAVIELLQAIKAQQEADMSVTITTLRKMRIEKGFSQKSMAEKVGINPRACFQTVKITKQV